METKRNVFEELQPSIKLPETARAEVLDRIEATKLMLDFWDLFAPKRVAVNLVALNQSKINQRKKKK
jgi:hypothetical protein